MRFLTLDAVDSIAWFIGTASSNEYHHLTRVPFCMAVTSTTGPLQIARKLGSLHPFSPFASCGMIRICPLAGKRPTFGSFVAFTPAEYLYLIQRKVALVQKRSMQNASAVAKREHAAGAAMWGQWSFWFLWGSIFSSKVHPKSCSCYSILGGGQDNVAYIYATFSEAHSESGGLPTCAET